MRPGGKASNGAGTIFSELLVGVSGVMLVLFILGHLAGNFFLFAGPDAYNAYAAHLHALGPLLWLARLGLISAFVLHVAFSLKLTLANRASRHSRYAVRTNAGGTNLAKKTMIYTGLLVFAFIVFHIVDFALGDQMGPRSVIRGLGSDESLGLYGVVWNSFASPLRSLFYVVALCAVGLHFSNAVSTIWVTFGMLPEAATAKVRRTAQVMGLVVALAFISIPTYVLAVTYGAGPVPQSLAAIRDRADRLDHAAHLDLAEHPASNLQAIAPFPAAPDGRISD